MSINDIHKEADTRMKKAVESFHGELSKLRTGRAHPSLIEHLKVSYYGNDTPLSQVASVTIGDPRTLVVTPWEKTMVQAIEKALMTADLGLNPATAGTVIRVPLPPLTEERRREMTKVVRDEAERARVAVRNIRRDGNNQLKDELKKKLITEDEERRAQDAIQKLTDSCIAEIDKAGTNKEKELMTV